MRSLLLPPRAMVLCGVLMLMLHHFAPLRQIVPHPTNWFGLAPIVAGLAIAAWHARLFRSIGTNINTFGEPGKLTTQGLFRHSRNPMYLGMLLTLSGIALVLGSLVAVLGPIIFFALAHYWYIPLEEQAMHQKFSDSYADYRSRVRRWL